MMCRAVGSRGRQKPSVWPVAAHSSGLAFPKPEAVALGAVVPPIFQINYKLTVTKIVQTTVIRSHHYVTNNVTNPNCSTPHHTNHDGQPTCVGFFLYLIYSDTGVLLDCTLDHDNNSANYNSMGARDATGLKP